MGNETSHKTPQGGFTETSFIVLPKSECQQIFHGLSVFEMCARIVNGTLNCNIQEGSPLVIENPSMGPYQPFPKIIIGIARKNDFFKNGGKSPIQ